MPQINTATDVNKPFLAKLLRVVERRSSRQRGVSCLLTLRCSRFSRESCSHLEIWRETPSARLRRPSRRCPGWPSRGQATRSRSPLRCRRAPFKDARHTTHGCSRGRNASQVSLIYLVCRARALPALGPLTFCSCPRFGRDDTMVDERKAGGGCCAARVLKCLPVFSRLRHLQGIESLGLLLPCATPESQNTLQIPNEDATVTSHRLRTLHGPGQGQVSKHALPHLVNSYRFSSKIEVGGKCTTKAQSSGEGVIAAFAFALAQDYPPRATAYYTLAG